MGIHDWIDLANGLGLIAITLIAVLLGIRVNRHDAFVAKVEEIRGDIREIKGLLKGAGIWK